MGPVEGRGTVPEHTWSIESQEKGLRIKMERYDFAAKTVSASGKKIEKGVTPKGLVRRVKYFKLEQAGQDTVYVNVASAAKALNLPRLKLWLARRKKGGADKLLQRQLEVLKNYENILKVLEKNDPAIAKKPYFRKSLMKTVKEGFKISEKRSQVLISSKLYSGGVFVEYLSQEKRVSFSVLEKKIGEGGFREVYNLIDATGKELQEGAQRVFVRVKEGDLNAQKGTLKEKAIIDYLNRNGNHEGILHPIEAKNTEIRFISPNTRGLRKQPKLKKSLAQVTAQARFMRGGDMSTNSLGNSSFHKLPPKERMELCRQLLSGLVFMHRQHFVHGDIKPANFLMNDKTNPTEVRISDLGGGWRADLNPGAKPTDFTSIFRLKEDHDRLVAFNIGKKEALKKVEENKKLKKTQKKEELKQVKETWENASEWMWKKFDVFSMGKSLAEIFISPEVSGNRKPIHSPFIYRKYDYYYGDQKHSVTEVQGVNEDKLRQAIQGNFPNMPEEVINGLTNLLVQSMNPKIRERLSAEELLEGWGALMKKI